MSAVITQTSAPSQLTATSGTAPELVLQPGTVIDARVLAVSDGLARILIAGMAIEALTEVALQPGANLKFAVTQTADGVRLAIVPPEATAQTRTGASAQASGSTPAPATSNAGATAQASLPRVAASPVAANPEAAAISQAIQTSAPRQASLSPLFANLPVIVASKSVPQQIQSAASQLLATRLPLDGGLTADGLRQAFQKSGLFLEATLARGTVPAGAPDLKAALVVFKHVLTGWLGQQAPAAQSPTAAPALTAIAQPSGPAQTPAQALAQPASAATAPPLVPNSAQGLAQNLALGLASDDAAGVRAQLLPGVVDGSVEGQVRTPASVPPQPAARALAELSGEIVRAATQAVARDATSLLREAVVRTADDPIARPSAHAAGQPIAARQSSEPAPPFRGAVPSPQAIASPSLAADASPASMGRELLDQTDAALARQTLLQVASLPDRPELSGANQTTQPRWSFEIPFATPQGTAVAQFEIERDGHNDIEGAAPTRVWRARFTLDVEPAGPVHAVVSLIGDKTAVRMWAERPDTAAQLRANTDALSLALRQAELEPGDILVGEGAPAQPRVRAGRFLDRAT
jgi:hypothetical protein